MRRKPRIKASEKPENIYILLPRFITTQEEGDKSGGKYLPAIIRDFEWSNIKFTFVISPARIRDENGQDRYYFTSDREKLIEDALRNLAIEDNIDFRIEDLTLDFTLSQLMNEILSIIHELEYAGGEIDTGIRILADIKYELINNDSELYFRPIERLIVSERDDDIYYRAQFSQLFFNRTPQFDFCFLRKE